MGSTDEKGESSDDKNGKSTKRKIISVAKELTSKFLALEINKFPYRPELNRFLPRSETKLLCPLVNKQLSEETKELEKERMLKFMKDHEKRFKRSLS